ncbi:MAG: ParB/RepB/Spo0J family partition protein [Deltaproteobacteria bacterium]|nr:ParB/RepB/Spo0J family partition protein [Deltaproteobacteria bacterium]
MPEKSTNHGQIANIELQAIDPSPFQRRQHFQEDKLKGLAASIQRDGLIEPIVVRPNGARYQLIAGERRWRAIRDYTDMKTVAARIINASDLEARRISAAENLQREDLSAIETIEAIVEIVDAELIEDKEYAAMGDNPADRVKKLLGKLDSVRSSRERGSTVSSKSKVLFHKFVEQIEKVFKNLPKPLEWRSFFNHDLPLLMDFCEEVREVSIQHRLNRSQTRALAKLKDASEEEFQEIAGVAQIPPKPAGEVYKASSNLNISELSGREIEEIAKKAVREKSRIEQNRPRNDPPPALEVKILLMNRLGIPVNRIAMRLKVNRKTVLKYSDNTPFLKTLRESLAQGCSVFETAQANACPESLVRSIALEGKTDQERFELLNWGLRTWDHWYFNDIDRRFGDDWPGRIPAQMIALRRGSGHANILITKE